MRRIVTVTLWGLLAGFLPLPAPAAESRGFELSVLVEGSRVSEFPWQGRTYVEALRGRSFTLRVSNPTGERIAVAISVDGRNVVDAKRTGERAATKWILDPWQTLDIPGWQISGDTARRFFFTETARSYAKWLGDTSNVGTIEAVFFRELRRVAAPLVPAPLSVPGSDRMLDRDESGSNDSNGPVGGFAGQDASPRSETSPPSAAQLREGARKESIQSRPREEDSYAATGIGERTSFPVVRVEFRENPLPAARIALRYEFRRELVRLGVLPSRGDLYARERARGFEPEYAPDPDRER